MRCLIFLLFGGVIVCVSIGAKGGEGRNLIQNGDFAGWRDGLPVGWRLEAQRDEIRPHLIRSVENKGRSWAELHALKSGLSVGWLVQRVDTSGMTGKWFRFSCLVRVNGDQDPQFNARISLDWQRKPELKGWMPTWDFVPIAKRIAHDIYLAERLVQVPPWSAGLTVLLGQHGGASGSVAFADVKLAPAQPPQKRVVKIATTYRPPHRATWEENLANIERLAERAAARGCDLILFGEGVTVVGTGKGYVDVAEPIPGARTEALSAVARKHSIYLAAGVYERDGEAAYNTAVLFDRKGNLVGRYRKVHLPYQELRRGLQPGAEYPVFDTDIGRIGIQVCYDHFFPETARCLALRGAEIILTPIWGDVRADGSPYEIVARARAIDNAVIYVTSTYCKAGSLIIDQLGRIVARTPADSAEWCLAVAELDLDLCRRFDLPFKNRPAFSLNYRVERFPRTYRPIVELTGEMFPFRK